jgi:hypothetical protein
MLKFPQEPHFCFLQHDLSPPTKTSKIKVNLDFEFNFKECPIWVTHHLN